MTQGKSVLRNEGIQPLTFLAVHCKRIMADRDKCLREERCQDINNAPIGKNGTPMLKDRP